MDYALYQIDTDAQNGETFNDAVYSRTRDLEERLIIKVERIELDVWNGNTKNYVTNHVMAGEDTIHAAFLSLMHSTLMVGSNVFTDLYTIDELNFDKPWWNAHSRKFYEYNGKLFLAHCNASVNYYDCIWSCFFNKDMLHNLKLDDIYELVKSGNWTHDKMLELMEKAENDLDGDGKMGADDRWGLMTHNSAAPGILHGFDERSTDIKDGVPVVLSVSDRMHDAITSVRELLQSTATMTNNKHQSDFGFTCVEGFANGKGLMLIETLGNAAKLREMPSDFGIVPLPKLDEKQENYISYYGGSAEALCVLKSASDLSYIGTVIEVMNALSYETVVLAYFDVVLTGKNTRDNESMDMLNIMFETPECELASLYNWGSYNTPLTSVLTGTAEIVSTLDAARPAAEAAIETFLENIKDE